MAMRWIVCPVLALLLSGVACGEEAERLRVFYFGNSLTGCSDPLWHGELPPWAVEMKKRAEKAGKSLRAAVLPDTGPVTVFRGPGGRWMAVSSKPVEGTPRIVEVPLAPERGTP